MWALQIGIEALIEKAAIIELESKVNRIIIGIWTDFDGNVAGLLLRIVDRHSKEIQSRRNVIKLACCARDRVRQ